MPETFPLYLLVPRKFIEGVNKIFFLNMLVHTDHRDRGPLE